MAFRWMSGLINPLYLQFRFLNFSFDRHGKRPSLEPHSWNLYFTVGAIWFWISWWVIWRLYSGLVYVWYFRKTFIVLAKYNYQIYFRSNCLGWLRVTGRSSWWISSKTQFCLVCLCVCVSRQSVICIGTSTTPWEIWAGAALPISSCQGGRDKCSSNWGPFSSVRFQFFSIGFLRFFPEIFSMLLKHSSSSNMAGEKRPLGANDLLWKGCGGHSVTRLWFLLYKGEGQNILSQKQFLSMWLTEQYMLPPHKIGAAANHSCCDNLQWNSMNINESRWDLMGLHKFEWQLILEQNATSAIPCDLSSWNLSYERSISRMRSMQRLLGSMQNLPSSEPYSICTRLPGCEQFSGGVTLETAVGQCGVKLDSSWLSVPATKGKLFDVRKFEVAFNFFICLLRATRPLVIWNPIQLHYIVDPWFLSLSPILQPLAVGKPCLKRFPPGISRRG